MSQMLSVAPDRSFLYQAAQEDTKHNCLTPPAEMISRLNRHFLSNAGVARSFAMIYGSFAQEIGEFRYVDAGRLGPIHLPRRFAPRIGETGPFRWDFWPAEPMTSMQ